MENLAKFSSRCINVFYLRLEHAEGEYIKRCCHGGERIYSGANAIGGQPREDYMNYEKLFF